MLIVQMCHAHTGQRRLAFGNAANAKTMPSHALDEFKLFHSESKIKKYLKVCRTMRTNTEGILKDTV